MLDIKALQAEAFNPTSKFAAIVATVAVVCVLLLIGSVSKLGNPQADATAATPAAPDQIVSPEEHSAFIHQGHERAAREGDAAPLPPTF